MIHSGIYRIVNIANGKSYIGSSVYVARRLKYHEKMLCSNLHFNRYLQNAWNKWTSIGFKFEVLLYCGKRMLLFYEQQAIDVFSTMKNGVYNLAPIAGSRLGTKMSEEAKQKIAVANKISMIGNTNPKGCKRSKEVRKRASDARKGFVFSEKSISKMSEAHKGQVPWNKGLTDIYSKETRRAMGADKKGTKDSEETRRKKSESIKAWWKARRKP